MTTLFKDVFLLDGGREKAERANVLISDGKIERITNEIPKADEVIEGRGAKALLPGFVNGHTHAAMCLLRGIGEEAPLMEWLKEKIWPVEAKLTHELIRAGTDLALLEMAKSGTTCFADMYFEMEQVAEAAALMGMRAGLCRGLMGDDQKRIDENIALAEKWHGHKGLINVQLGPHAPYTVPPKSMKNIVELAKKMKIGVHTHLLEAEWELSFFRDELKMTPEDWLTETGLLTVPVVLAHCVWLDPDLINKLDFSNATLAHNPNSNLKLGSGVFPLDKWLKNGVSVSLGTDGASSNNRLDIWGEMRNAALFQKGVFKDPLLGKASDVLRMATYDGAKSLGFENKGMINEGWAADFVLVDLDVPEYVGAEEDNLACFIVYAGSSENVEGTMVDGKWIYKDGKFPTVNREAILKDARCARAKLIE